MTLEGDCLVVTGEDGGGREAWPLANLRLLGDEGRRGPVRLAEGERRLTVDDPAFAAALRTAAPRLWRHGRRGLQLAGAAAVVAAVVAGLVWWQGSRLVDAALALLPPAWEEPLGEAAMADYATRRCTGAAGQAALDGLLRRLGDGVPSPYRLSVAVVDVPVVNAYALPGGRMIILRGLLAQARSADEVAGVLAHEMTHELKRHPARLLISATGTLLAFDLLLGAGHGASWGATLTTLAFSRAAEAEADAGAILLLERAGIATAPLADFHERIAATLPAALPQYLSTHPASAGRAALARAAQGAAAQPALSAEEWKALAAICGAR